MYDFLAEKSPDAARAAAASILRQAELLESFPKAGRPATGMKPEYRELSVPFGNAGYVLLYHCDATTEAVTILSVRHQKEAGF